MNEVFEKIIERLEELRYVDPCDKFSNCQDCQYLIQCNEYSDFSQKNLIDELIETIRGEAKNYNNGWIPCSEKMPPVETEVFIIAKRKNKYGEVRYITTTAFYEDGTVLESDSSWNWYEIDGEYDEENDCYIIPEGWWEYRHYNPEETYNNAVDDEVIAWQPLPDQYIEQEEDHGQQA